MVKFFVFVVGGIVLGSFLLFIICSLKLAKACDESTLE